MKSILRLSLSRPNKYLSLPKSFSLSVVSRDAAKGVPYKDNIKDKKSNTSTELPEHVDVVIIGGGSLGCSTLYHLAKLGITNTVLVEAHQVTAGTTWHTAGLIWQLRPNDTDIQLLSRTRNMLLSLEEETGVEPGWINNGGMFVASSKVRLDEYKRLMTIGKAFGIESYILDKNETKKIYPLMNIDDVYGSLYCPGDGTVEPAGYCTALCRYATRRGAKLVENCKVNDIKTEESLFGTKKVTEVVTSKGSLKTNSIVNSTGCWANNITEMVGVKIPLVSMKHAYIVTERIEGIENMPNLRDHDASVYLRLQGDALSVGGYEYNPIIVDKVDDSPFSLYDLDWEVFSFTINGAVNRIPVLEKTGIKSTVCGPESFTPDHKPIMGEDPTVMGFYHCVGFNSAGMMLGGGCGQEIANWIKYGRPRLDMYGYDIRRFNPSLNSNTKWAVERSHEAYAKNYAIVYKNDEPLAGRNMKKSPLHEILHKSGCVYQERHGWERPGWFFNEPAPVTSYDYYGAYGTEEQKDTSYRNCLKEDYSFDFPAHFKTIRKECLSCRNKAALFDMSYFGKFLLTGPDAEAAADWVFSADVRRKPGITVYSCMLNKMGGTESDLTVSILDANTEELFSPKFKGVGYYIGAGGGAAQQNWAHLVKELNEKKFNVKLHNISEEMAMISLQGPASKKILESVSDSSFSNDDFPFSTHKPINVIGLNALAIRITFPGELGWELHIPKASAVHIYEVIMNAGKKYDLINAGYRALESLSTEKGYVHWHADLRINDTPLEAGLGFTCKLKSDIPFLGREALQKQKEQGINKKLVTFTLEENIPIWGLEAIWRDEKVVGFTRVADYAHSLGKSIAHGYVSDPTFVPVTKQFLENGNWNIEAIGVKHKALIHIKPPFDPKNLRIKGMYSEISEDLVY